jgi:hypothetical protein
MSQVFAKQQVEIAVGAGKAGPARGYLSALRRANIDDAARLHRVLVDTARRTGPPDIEPRIADAVAAVCVSTLMDPHDFERAVERLEQDGVASLEEAIEVLVDWTARRERARMARAKRRGAADSK